MKTDKNNLFAFAGMIITIITAVISAIAVILGIQKDYPIISTSFIVLLIILLIVFLIIFFIYQSKGTKKEAVEGSKSKQVENLKYRADILDYIAYAGNRNEQIEHIEKQIENNQEPIWIIHGAENQCLEELLTCIQLFHIDLCNSNIERTYFIDCPEIIESDFEETIKKRIGRRLFQNHESLKSDWKNISNLIKEYLKKNTLTFYTIIKTSDLNKKTLKILYKLIVTLKNIMNFDEKYPLIICFLIIYEEGKCLRRIHFNKINNKMIEELQNKNRRALSNFVLPQVKSVERKHLRSWERWPDVQKIFDINSDKIDDIFRKSKKKEMPMKELANTLKTFQRENIGIKENHYDEATI